jgi:hypothetical protein
LWTKHLTPTPAILLLLLFLLLLLLFLLLLLLLFLLCLRCLQRLPVPSIHHVFSASHWCCPRSYCCWWLFTA